MICFIHYVDIMHNLHQVPVGLWLCTFLSFVNVGLKPCHLYKLFLFSLQRSIFSLFKYIQYEVYFSLLNFVVLKMLYGMLQ